VLGWKLRYSFSFEDLGCIIWGIVVTGYDKKRCYKNILEQSVIVSCIFPNISNRSCSQPKADSSIVHLNLIKISYNSNTLSKTIFTICTDNFICCARVSPCRQGESRFQHHLELQLLQKVMHFLLCHLWSMSSRTVLRAVYSNRGPIL